MRVLFLILGISLAGCTSTNKDQYEAVCGLANGYFFADGEDIPLNIKANYLEKVPLDALECRAGEGDFYAQYNLGRLYLEGQRVDQDFEKAADLFLASGGATINNAFEQRGFRYMPGFGSNVTIDTTSGFPPAQYALGLMYYSGLIGEKDTKNAVFWMKKAAALGNQEAKDFLEKIEGEK